MDENSNSDDRSGGAGATSERTDGEPNVSVQDAASHADTAPDADADAKTSDLYVVGLGASAGGVKALRGFFEHAPTDRGIAYVAILHLSPDYESRLAEILAGATAMPVVQVREAVRLKPDHVYVIAPNAKLEIEDGHLTVSGFEHAQERRAPIDIFFRTLAEAYLNRAIGCVLSGTGANGSVGVKTIKEAGGVVFAQDPAEADYDQMPRNSIATDLVDYVLPVAEMGARIADYQRQSALVRLTETAEQAAAMPIDAEAALRDSTLR